ncbi:MAG: thioesterase family protein [Clostridia bacterium]
MKLNPGMKNVRDAIVRQEDTAEKAGSGMLSVYATPSMIALMENTAYSCVGEYLDDGQTTVGTMINVRHVSATPIGMRIGCEAELIEIDGKKLLFKVRAFDECGLIGDGIHERYIVTTEKFMSKTQGKRAKTDG